jgi:putative restriction endonuclease
MNFWWVNANQTYEHTLAGGFLWSPKKKKNGGRNEFYDTMPRVRPGDPIFVFRNMFITAIGIATSPGYSAERPEEGFEFNDWNRDGWRVDVDLYPLKHQIRPRDHMRVLSPLLPSRYSPLRDNGDGLQGVYLASVPQVMATALGSLIGLEYSEISGSPISPTNLVTTEEAPRVAPSVPEPSVRVLDERPASVLRSEVPTDTPDLLGDLDVARVAMGRAEQSVLRNLLVQDTTVAECAICGMTYPVGFLVAAHIKPRAKCSDDEKRDVPAIAMLACRFGCDELYERGYISVASNGSILTTSAATLTDDMEIRLSEFDGLSCSALSHTNEKYFLWHRENIFLD